MNPYEISVVIPCFNAEAYVCAAVRSALQQQLPGLEVIVVDDGSSDGSVARLRAEFPGLHIIEQANGGVASARNAGVARARGKWIAFLDADDVWLPGKLRSQLELLRSRPDARMAYAAWHVWASAEPEPSPALLKELMDRAPHPAQQGPSGWIYADLLLDCVVWTSTVVVERQLLQDSGGFDTTLRIGEDYDLWLRLSRQTPILRLDTPAAIYRLHPSSITRSVPSRNYRVEVIERALQRWGHAAPDGRRADAAAVARSLARSWGDFAGAHLTAGNLRTARVAALAAVRKQPSLLLGWTVLAKTAWRALAGPVVRTSV